MKGLGKSQTAIGLDVGSRTIKAAQLVKSGSFLSLMGRGASHWTASSTSRIVALSMLLRMKAGLTEAGQQVNPVRDPESNGLPAVLSGQAGLSASDSTRTSNRPVPSTSSGQALSEVEGLDIQEIINIRAVLRRQGFCGNDVVLAAPEKRLLHGVFEIPPATSGQTADREEMVAQIARMELSRMHSVAPDSFEMVCWPLGGWEPSSRDGSKSTHRGGQAIAVGCPHDVANELLDLFEGAGFNVRALDLRSTAAARACMSLAAQPPALTAILDLGWSSTKLLFVYGGTVIYERHLTNKSIAHLTTKLSGMFGITEQSADQTISTIGLATNSEAGDYDQQSTEAVRKILAKHFDIMLEELKTPFDYASHQYPGEGVKRLLLIGGGARIFGLSQYIQEALGIEVIAAAPGDLVPNPTESQILTKLNHPAMTVAVGLAMFNEE